MKQALADASLVPERTVGIDLKTNTGRNQLSTLGTDLLRGSRASGHRRNRKAQKVDARAKLIIAEANKLSHGLIYAEDAANKRTHYRPTKIERKAAKVFLPR